MARRVRLGPIAAPTNHVHSHRAAKAAPEQEREVTVHISELVEVACETEDYQCKQFIEWYLQGQVEEESTMQDLFKVAERTCEIPMLLERVGTASDATAMAPARWRGRVPEVTP